MQWSEVGSQATPLKGECNNNKTACFPHQMLGVRVGEGGRQKIFSTLLFLRLLLSQAVNALTTPWLPRVWRISGTRRRKGGQRGGSARLQGRLWSRPRLMHAPASPTVSAGAGRLAGPRPTRALGNNIWILSLSSFSLWILLNPLEWLFSLFDWWKCA